MVRVTGSQPGRARPRNLHPVARDPRTTVVAWLRPCEPDARPAVGGCRESQRRAWPADVRGGVGHVGRRAVILGTERSHAVVPCVAGVEVAVGVGGPRRIRVADVHGPGAACAFAGFDLVTDNAAALVGRGRPGEVDSVSSVCGCGQPSGRTGHVRVRGCGGLVRLRPCAVGVDRGYPVVAGCALRETGISVVRVIVSGVGLQRPPRRPIGRVLNEVASDSAGPGGRRDPTRA